MTSDALPSRDIARPVLRVAFTLAWLLGALLAAALVVTVANAAGDTASAASPADCSSIDDAAARLACFDGHFPRPRSAREATSAAPAVAAATTTGDAAVGPEAAFGLDDTVRRNRGERPAAPQAPRQIESTVSRLEPREPGRHRITLANGQVWEQTEVSAGFQPRVGEAVSVRQAALNSFLMRGRSGSAVRARRLR